MKRLRFTRTGWFLVTGYSAGLRVWGTEIVIRDHQGRAGWQTILIGPFPSAKEALSCGW